MALPKLLKPEFGTKIPSTGQDIRFRPFLVKEEKVLYMAMEGQDPKEIRKATMNVLDACILTPDVDVKKFQTFDMEFLFLQLRAKSVNEIMEVNIPHNKIKDCQAYNKIKIHVDDIKVKFNPDHKDVIQITDDIGVKLKLPPIDTILDVKKLDINATLKLIGKCVVNVFDKNTTYEQFTELEIKDFLEALTQDQFTKLNTFFNTMPKLQHEVKWICKTCGQEDSVVLEGLQSFFT